MIDVDNCVRICSCWLVGKTSMMRLTVPWAPVVCRVPNTMWPGLRRRDRRLDRLQVAHFADQDHVRVLPQGAADRLGETGHVHADFPLVDRRLLVRVIELDRVLDRDDVVVDSSR